METLNTGTRLLWGKCCFQLRQQATIDCNSENWWSIFLRVLNIVISKSWYVAGTLLFYSRFLFNMTSIDKNFFCINFIFTVNINMKFSIKLHENKYRLCKLRDIKDSGLSTKLLFPPNITNSENLYLPRNLNI